MKFVSKFFAVSSFAALVACSLGCPGSAKSAADVALDLGYQVVGAGAMTVKAFDAACVGTARRIAGFSPDGDPPAVMDKQKLDEALALAEKCDAAEEAARGGLKLAEDALRTWSASKTGDLGCAASRFLSAFDEFEKIGSFAGFAVPADVTHVIEVAKSILAMTGAGGACHVR